MTIARTIPFRNTPSQLMRRTMSLWLARWGWFLLIPITIFIILGFNRWEWFLVSLMLIFIVYPSVLVFVYFKYGLKPENRKLISPMFIEIKQNHLTINYLEETKDDKSEENNDSERVGGDETITESVNVEFDRIKGMTLGKKSMTIRFHQPSYATLTIDDAFWDESKGNVNKNEIIDVFIKNGIKFA